MDGNLSAVLVAVCASSVPAIFAWLTSRKTHNEVKTNHGIRAGERIESLGDDMTIVKGALAAQALETRALRKDFTDHASQDLAFQERVEPFLKKEN